MDAATDSLKRSGENLGNLSSLPDEALCSVFSQVDTWRDTFRLSLTCKQLYGIGKPYLHRSIGCLNCSHPLVSASVSHDANQGSLSISFRLNDGEAMCLREPDDLIPNALNYGEEGPCTSWRLIRELIRQRIAPTEEALGLKVRQINCSHCNLYLGVQITEIKGLRAGADLDMSSWRLGLVLGNVFCCFKYLTILDSRGQNEDFTLPGILWQDFNRPSSLYLCAMQRVKTGTDGVLAADFEHCNSILFDDRAILSKDHWWKVQEHSFSTPPPLEEGPGASGANGSPLPPAAAEETAAANTASAALPAAAAAVALTSADASNGEPAWYINHLDAPVLVDQPVEMNLAQGKMMVSRVWCQRCTRVIGWKFIECLENGKNIHHCGRWGILEGRVKVGTLPEGKYIRKKH